MSAKPAPKKKQRKQTPAERANLVRGGRGKRGVHLERTSEAQFDKFVRSYIVTSSLEEACEVAKIPVSRGYKLAKRPDFQERINATAKDIHDKAITKMADNFVLEVKHLDKRTHEIINMPAHPITGFSAHAGLIKTGYQRCKAIDTPRMIQNNANQAATAVALAGATSFQVYESAWLTAKKARWDKQLEEKHGLESSTSSS